MLGTREPKLQPLRDDLRCWTDAIMLTVSPDRLRNDVATLPAPRNRIHSPDEMDRADEIILKVFSEAGWLVERHSFDATNVMGCLDYGAGLLPAGVIPTLYPNLSGANILGWKPGLSSTKAIIVGAHHDTIRDSPGADDNTASVAALFELARVLAPYSFEKTIVLAAMDMEEIGFFGSQELVRRFGKENQIEGAIIYETMAYTSSEPGSQEIPPGIGWLYPEQMRRIRQRDFTGDWTMVFYKAFAASLAKSFAEGLAHTAHPQVPVMIRDPLDITLLRRVIRRITPNASAFGRSDHLSFWKAGIPAIMVTDTANFRNPNYHQPTDTPETLDYDRLAAIVGATAVTLARSAGLATGTPPKDTA